MGKDSWIIGLAGLPGSGKTEIASILEKERGYSRLSFGSRLKEVAKLIYGMEDRFIYGTQADKEEIISRLGISGRYILQRLGTEVCRNIHPETWVLAVMNQVLSSDKERFVIDDVRFQNEVEFTRGFNQGEVWLVDRPDTQTDRQTDRHISDRPDLLKGVDRKLVNDSTLEALKERVIRLEESFRKDNREEIP